MKLIKIQFLEVPLYDRYLMLYSLYWIGV